MTTDPNTKKLLIFLIIIAVIIFIIWLWYRNQHPLARGKDLEARAAPHAGGGGGGRIGGGGGGRIGGVGFSNASVHTAPIHTTPIHTNPVTQPIHTTPVHRPDNKPDHRPDNRPDHQPRPDNKPRPDNRHVIFRPRPSHFNRFIFIPVVYSLYYPLWYRFNYPVEYVPVNPDMQYDHTIGELENLWNDHVRRTRAYVQATFRNSSDLPAVTTSLLQNAVDFAKYYNSAEIGTLMKNHLLIAMDIVTSMIKNGTPDMALVAKWNENASQLADQFANLTNVSSADSLTMLKDHLDLLTKEVTAEYNCVKKNMPSARTDSLNIYTQIAAQAKTMADTFFNA